jgi:hypothetical protein
LISVGLMRRQAIRLYFPMPIRDRHIFRLRSDVIRKRLNVIDLLINRKGVKTWWMKGQNLSRAKAGSHISINPKPRLESVGYLNRR